MACGQVPLDLASSMTLPFLLGLAALFHLYVASRLLPDLDNCLLVLDEGHHLPATALEQFACAMDLSRTNWVDKLATRVVRIGGLLAVASQ